MSNYDYSGYEKALIEQAYKDNVGLRNGWLRNLADELGRSKQNISRYARSQGWTDRHRTRNEKNPGEPSVRNLVCEVCKEDFITPSHAAKRKTCSAKCLKEYKIAMMSNWHNIHEHPRGMLGKQHTEKYCAEISKRVARYWKEVTPEELERRRERAYKTMVENGTLLNRGGHSTARGGKRKDLNNTYFRSRWEANYARYLNFMGIEWAYEPDTFIFEAIKRGTRSYTPDFYIPSEDKRIEIKGYLDQKGRTKIKRLKKYYPEEFAKLHFVVSHLGCKTQVDILDILGVESVDKFEYYKEINDTLGGIIEGWE